MPIRLPQQTKFDFITRRWIGFVVTGLIIIGSIVSLSTRGLNFGIDFAGGILIEVQTPGPADLAAMRGALGNLDIGEVALQTFGKPNEVLIRVQRQDGDEKAQMAALDKVRGALGTGYDFRRTEVVGPKVGDELVRDGVLAVALSILAIGLYVWFRFEWQFGIGALLATIHDVVGTFGFFSITGLEFNLTIVAAILTIAGYSINDTVVEYDRVRENLRKYKSMPLAELLNLSINQTLSRTILTGGTTLAAVLAMLVLGGPVLEGFSAAMIFGVLIGTYSSIYVAMPVLIYFNLRTLGSSQSDEDAEEQPAG